jgi:hypothetical protein
MSSDAANGKFFQAAKKRRASCRFPGNHGVARCLRFKTGLLSFYPHERGTVKGKNKPVIFTLIPISFDPNRKLFRTSISEPLSEFF